MKKLIYIPFLLIIVACGSESEEQIAADGGTQYETELDYFEGTFYFIKANDTTSQYEMHENCWCKCVETFEFSEFAGSSGEHYFAMHGHHSTMYLLEEYKKEEHKITFKGKLEDESSNEVFSFELKDEQNNLWTLQTPHGNYELVKKEKKDEYPTVPCQDDLQEEPMSELDYMSEIFKAFFNLQKGGEKLASYIPDNGLEIITPGPGVSPIVETVTNSQEVTATNLFNTPAYERLLEYMQMHNNEERVFLEFVEELPDRCMPPNEALFLKTTYVEEKPTSAIAMLTKMNDEQGEIYTYVIIHFEYTDRVRIKKIDASDCGA